ncbi:MAG: GDYXXLXY domain-containing protein [Verrucomicrobiales bacterium]|jgi:uncharacterized membrane-anchored protein|nr:GDYXXLXY domain-containing protein [Verrucomicrobiales bacterium]
MKNLRLLLFAVFAIVSVAAPVSIIWKYEAALRHGVTYKFRTKPVDPYDAFRGRYVTLDFAADSLDTANDGYWRKGPYYVRLANDAEGFAKPVAASLTPLTGSDVIMVDSAWNHNQSLRFTYPFNRYYLPEDLASLAEQLYQRANRDAADRESTPETYVTVSVYRGVGVLKELYLHGRPVREAISAELEQDRR